MSGYVRAATISCDPFHVVLDNGQTATSTVTWSGIAPTQTIQVYVSVNNGVDQLLQQQQGPGSTSYPGITFPNVYVFKLYDGTGHSNLLTWTATTTQNPPAYAFGYNYLPTNLDWFWVENYPTKKTRLKQDLMHMLSLKGKVIRFNFWNNSCQMDGANDRWLFYDGQGHQFSDLVANMVDWLSGPCYDNGVRVFIAFHNNWFQDGPEGSSLKWYQTAGMTLPGLLEAVRQWMTQVVTAVEANPKAKQVVFAYDFQNEVSIQEGEPPNIITYLQHCYDTVPVPMGKHMASFCNKNKITNWPLNMGNRRLDYVDFHYYSDAQDSSDQPQQFSYWVDLARSTCPNATILMGEYGQKGGGSFPSNEGTYPTNEFNQSHKMIGLAQGGKDADIAYHMAWDFIPPVANTEPAYGMLYTEHQPKDVLGAMSTFNDTLYNPDAEIGSNGIPDGWTANGSKAITFTRSGPNKPDAATNSYYAKLTTSVTKSTDWASIDTPTIHNPYIGGKTIYINAYVRTNMKYQIGIFEYDSNYSLIQQRFGSQISTSTTSWQSYQHRVGPWSPVLHANTHYVTVQVKGTRNTQNSCYLDVDTVSVFALGMDREYSPADLNRDWSVDLLDLAIFTSNWLDHWQPRHQHLIHRYSFNGNCNDSVGSAHGTLVNYDSSAIWQTGKLYLNNAATFDAGLNKYFGVIPPTDTTRGAHVNLPKLLEGLDQATIEIWMETPLDFDGAYVYSFGGGVNGDGDSSGPELTLQNRSSARLATHWNQSAGWWGHDLSGYPNATGPACYALTVEEDITDGYKRPNEPWSMGDRVRVFIDSTQRAEFNNEPWEGPGLNDPVKWYETANCLGKTWQYGYKGNVILDELRIYDVALTADEIAADYADGPDVTLTQSSLGDINGDGQINFKDFAEMAKEWNP